MDILETSRYHSINVVQRNGGPTHKNKIPNILPLGRHFDFKIKHDIPRYQRKEKKRIFEIKINQKIMDSVSSHLVALEHNLKSGRRTISTF
jgi:hypothetical protein